MVFCSNGLACRSNRKNTLGVGLVRNALVCSLVVLETNAWLFQEKQFVAADLDPVVVAQCGASTFLTIHHRSVMATQVLDDIAVVGAFNPRMRTAHRLMRQTIEQFGFRPSVLTSGWSSNSCPESGPLTTRRVAIISPKNWTRFVKKAGRFASTT